jgi:hypothetical protein
VYRDFGRCDQYLNGGFDSTREYAQAYNEFSIAIRLAPSCSRELGWPGRRDAYRYQRTDSDFSHELSLRCVPMRDLNILGCAAAVCAALLLTACGGSLPAGTPTIPGAAQAFIERPWILPEAKRGDLLYISEYGGGVVDVFSFPRGEQVGALSGFNSAQGECVDKNGDVFVLNANINQGQPSILEFAHGGTSPIATLEDNNQDPYGCSVDPLTGNLAVSNQSGAVAIYAKAEGNPTYLTDPYQELMLWCGYDHSGNLFVDGLNRKINPQFDELPKGRTTFNALTLDKTIGFPGNIQWDGSHLAVGDDQYQGKNTSAIDQVDVSGSNGSIVGTTVLNGSEQIFGAWIEGNRVIGPEEGPSFDQVDYWRFPAGGDSTKSLRKSAGFFDGPFGAVVSTAR